jgi:hypothetical protein
MVFARLTDVKSSVSEVEEWETVKLHVVRLVVSWYFELWCSHVLRWSVRGSDL